MKKVLKVLSVLTAAMLIFTLAACGNKDNGSAQPAEENKESETAEAYTIAGTWENSEYGTAFIFNEDGTGKLTGPGYSLSFIYEDKGTELDITYAGSDDVQTSEYTISGKVLTLAGTEYTRGNK